MDRNGQLRTYWIKFRMMVVKLEKIQYIFIRTFVSTYISHSKASDNGLEKNEIDPNGNLRKALYNKLRKD